ncbi:hypothetical protein ACIQMY_12375 [Streptomyces sp. NPDC091368]|uniref:hypothetical protein n=1 Tax=Streptomyces sp. NPDC091368 TaxID=3365993 RepID=UPI0037FFF0C7
MTTKTSTPTSTSADDLARTTRTLRFTALGGFAVLLALLVLTAALVLGDAVSGDGRSGAFTTAAFWTFPVGAGAGLTALAVPRDLMATGPRRALVIGQYALGAVGVLLQLLD